GVKALSSPRLETWGVSLAASRQSSPSPCLRGMRAGLEVALLWCRPFSLHAGMSGVRAGPRGEGRCAHPRAAARIWQNCPGAPTERSRDMPVLPGPPRYFFLRKVRGQEEVEHWPPVVKPLEGPDNKICTGIRLYPADAQWRAECDEAELAM